MPLVLFNTLVTAQYTSYTPLYTDGSFTKTIDVNLAVGTIGAGADANSGSANYNIPIVVPLVLMA